MAGAGDKGACPQQKQLPMRASAAFSSRQRCLSSYPGYCNLLLPDFKIQLLRLPSLSSSVAPQRVHPSRSLNISEPLVSLLPPQRHSRLRSFMYLWTILRVQHLFGPLLFIPGRVQGLAKYLHNKYRLGVRCGQSSL